MRGLVKEPVALPIIGFAPTKAGLFAADRRAGDAIESASAKTRPEEKGGGLVTAADAGIDRRRDCRLIAPRGGASVGNGPRSTYRARPERVEPGADSRLACPEANLQNAPASTSSRPRDPRVQCTVGAYALSRDDCLLMRAE